MQLADSRIAALGHEAVVEAAHQRGRGGRARETRDAAAGTDEERPQVVDPMRLVGVVVGVEHRVDPARARRYRLKAQVG